MELSKEQYNQLRELIKQIDHILNTVSGLSSKGEGNRKYWNNRMGVLAEVMLKGGVVSIEEWSGIGDQHEYDRRGLGGFFVGTNASMVAIGNNKRAITDSGIKEVKDWLDSRWSIKPYDEQIKKYKTLGK